MYRQWALQPDASETKLTLRLRYRITDCDKIKGGVEKLRVLEFKKFSEDEKHK